MRIGVLGPPRTVIEGRVLLTPRHAGQLDAAGATILVETGAGQRAGYQDADFLAEGAAVVPRSEVLANADLILSVAPPDPIDAKQIPNGQHLLGFLHAGRSGAACVAAWTEQGGTALALEHTKDSQGRTVFRERMAEVAGIVSVELASRLLLTGPGRGVLLAGLPGVPPAAVVIIGAGALGRAAAKAFAGAGAMVTVLDRNLRALEAVEAMRLGRVQTLLARSAEIQHAASWADVLVAAIRVSDGELPKLLSPFGGKPGAVWLDLAIDEGGCIEGSRPVYAAEEAYVMEGVVMCPVPNLASWAARTASRVGSALLVPTLLDAARRGLDPLQDAWLFSGRVS